MVTPGTAIAETRNWNGAVYAPSDVARLEPIAAVEGLAFLINCGATLPDPNLGGIPSRTHPYFATWLVGVA
jgi:hypothetical protein